MKIRKRTRPLIGLIITSLLSITCGVISSQPPSATSLSPTTTSAVAVNTASPLPTDTLYPTDTPQSTNTPLPTNPVEPTATFDQRPLEFKVIFTEDFEDYPVGVLGDVPNTPWVRAEIGRVGNVTKFWVHSGAKNLQINSFVYNTEINYVKLDLDYQPAQLKIELWYTPDGYFIYTDFAEIGLSNVTSKFDMEKIAGFWADDHDVFFKAAGMAEDMQVFNELEYGRGPADMGMGTPKHNYIRAEFDFQNSVVRFYIGVDSNAPLRATANFDGSLDFNAFYISGGLNPTYIDDINIEASTAAGPAPGSQGNNVSSENPTD